MTSAPALNDWQASVAGIITGVDTPFEFVEILGWHDLPAIDSNAAPRPRAHGNFSSDEFARSRTITLVLEAAQDSSDSLASRLDDLRTALPPAGSEDPIEVWVKLPGEVAKLARCKPRRLHNPIDTLYEHGVTQVRVVLRADDGRKYGEDIVASTSFPSPSGGLEFDLFTDGAGTALAYLDFGEASADGKVTVANDGNAEISCVFAVSGPIPSEGFLIREQGGDAYLRYEASVPSGSVLTLDGVEGDCLLDGVADRSANLTFHRWPVIPARSAAVFVFESLGAATAASLSVTSASAWW